MSEPIYLDMRLAYDLKGTAAVTLPEGLWQTESVSYGRDAAYARFKKVRQGDRKAELRRRGR